MDGLLNSIMSSLFGQGSSFGADGLMGILGSEGFANLLKGGASLMSGMQMGDMLDFQKDLASKADARTNILFNQDQQDRDAAKNLDFG